MGLFKKDKINCLNCGSDDTNVEKFSEQDSPDFDNIKLLPIVMFCRKCKYGFNIIGTKKK